MGGMNDFLNDFLGLVDNSRSGGGGVLSPRERLRVIRRDIFVLRRQEQILIFFPFVRSFDKRINEPRLHNVHSQGKQKHHHKDLKISITRLQEWP